MAKIRLINKLPTKSTTRIEMAQKMELRRVNLEARAILISSPDLETAMKRIDKIVSSSSIKKKLFKAGDEIYANAWAKVFEKKIPIKKAATEGQQLAVKLWVDAGEKLHKEFLVRYANEVKEITTKRIKEEVTKSEAVKQLRERNGVAQTFANRNAESEAHSLNATVTQIRDLQIGAESAVWRTMEDDRVRGNPSGKYPDAEPSHFALNNRKFDPTVGMLTIDTGEYIMPGEQWGCRCISETEVEVND